MGKFSKSKFTLDTFWLIGAQLILILSGLIINLIIAGSFGATELGIFNQTLGYYAVLASIFSLGLNNTLIKKISSINEEQLDERKEAILLSTNLFLTTIISCIFTLIIIYLAKNQAALFSSDALAEALIIPFYSLPFYNLNKNFMAYFTGKRRQKDFSLIRTLRWTLIITYIIGALLLKQSLNQILYCFLFAESILLVYCLIKTRNILSFNIKWSEAIDNLAFGLKSFTSELFAVFNNKFDLLILGYFLSNYEMGIYSFFIFFAKSLYIFPGILQQNLNPIISKLWDENKIEELQQKVNQIRKINSIIILAQSAMIGMIYYVLILFFKQDFKDSYPYLVVSLVGIIPSALVYWSGSMLIMAGKLKENINRTFLIMALSVSATFILSYLYGLWGATLAVCAASMIAFFILKIYVRKSLDIKII
jgi:O-antigen/teichoic acid export membrane protein